MNLVLTYSRLATLFKINLICSVNRLFKLYNFCMKHFSQKCFVFEKFLDFFVILYIEILLV